MVLQVLGLSRACYGQRPAKTGRARQTLGCQAATKIRIVGIAPDSFVGGVYDPKEHAGDEFRYGEVILCPSQILVEALGKERAYALG